MIASSHPYAFEPLGKITASVEPAIIDLANLWPTTVVADIVCSNSDCKKHICKVKYEVQELIITPPKSTSRSSKIKDQNYSLQEVFLDRLVYL